MKKGRKAGAPYTTWMHSLEADIEKKDDRHRSGTDRVTLKCVRIEAPRMSPMFRYVYDPFDKFIGKWDILNKKSRDNFYSRFIIKETSR